MANTRTCRPFPEPSRSLMFRQYSNDYCSLVMQCHIADQGAVIMDYRARWHVEDRPNIHAVIVQWAGWMMMDDWSRIGHEKRKFLRHCQLDKEWRIERRKGRRKHEERKSRWSIMFHSVRLGHT